MIKLTLGAVVIVTIGQLLPLSRRRRRPPHDHPSAPTSVP